MMRAFQSLCSTISSVASHRIFSFPWKVGRLTGLCLALAVVVCGSGNFASAQVFALRQAALWDEVKDLLDRPGMALSGGQQQRLCIARAIAVEPEVILMDEPTAAIDPIATAKIEDLIEELEEKYTIVIVTHNMQQAARISDFTAFFYQGRIVEFGPTEMIFTKPAMKQTEDYVTGRFG